MLDSPTKSVAIVAIAAAVAMAQTPAAEAHHASRRAAVDAIVDWNRIALHTTSQAPFNPPRETRSVAIVQAAVLDAVSSITRRHAAYLIRVRAPRGASLPAAVAAAAHTSLTALYPAQRASLDAQYAQALAGLPPGRARDDGAAVGDTVATAVQAVRAHDGAEIPVVFTPTGGPGRWVPTPPGLAPALEPGWGGVRPFVLRSGAELRPPPPPASGSRRFLRDLHEIEAVGATDGDRTADQTEAARFWVATAPQLWNQAVQQLSLRGEPQPTRAALAFAMLNLAGADAFIAAWDAKFAYQQWRPVTGIRATTDPSWTPLLTTPPFPDYPAAHTTFAGAAETVLTSLFRDGAFVLTSATAGNAQHAFARFHAVADEVEDARVWGGVHWRSSSEVGRRLGRRIGSATLRRLR
jgi:hypothetical protein